MRISAGIKDVSKVIAIQVTNLLQIPDHRKGDVASLLFPEHRRGGMTMVDDASLLTSGDKVAVCYLCLDGGLDDADQPLRRDCACRGTDSGFVHLACLTNYAESKSKQACRDMIEFVNPWVACPHCHQEYQNELRIDIATKFISFVRRQYPDDTQKQVCI